MAETTEKPIGMIAKPTRPQEFYDSVKRKFAEERDLRLNYRPEGTAQYTSELSGGLAKYEVDPYAGEVTPREPINDTVEVPVYRRRLLGAADLGAAARARRREYPDRRARRRRRRHLVLEPLPGRRVRRRRVRLSAAARRDWTTCPRTTTPRARRFSRTARRSRRSTICTSWRFSRPPSPRPYGTRPSRCGTSTTDRGDHMKARFVICANGTLSKPKLAKIKGLETFKGHSFHTSRWDYAYTKPDLSGLEGQSRRHHRHRRDGGAGDSRPGRGGQGALRLPAHAFVDRYPRRLADRSRTGRAELQPGWQAKRRARARDGAADDRGAEGEAGRDVARGEDPPAGKREHRSDDEDPSAHRCDRQGQGHRRGAQAVVHADVQAARASTTTTCRPSTGPTSIWSILTARASPRSPKRARCSRASSTSSTC